MIEPRKDKIPLSSWRFRLHEIIFEADTTAGKTFDIVLILLIAMSIIAVMLESVSSIRSQHGPTLNVIEWVFTILFTIEYIFRIICIGKPVRYITSFFGIVDLLAVIPTYLDLFLPGSRFLFVIRVLRLLRIFRVLKLVKYMGEANILLAAMRGARRKIFIFLFAVITIAIIVGSAMYVIEGEAHGFTSIPKSVYWAVVTMTTVGYGDMSPQSPLGQTLAALLMIVGYSIIAVPTGIMSAEFTQVRHKDQITSISCPECSGEGHDHDAVFCKHCAAPLHPYGR